MCTLAFGAPHAHDETVQLTAQEVALLLQLLDAFLQPGVLLQSDVQVSSQVGHQDERAVLGVRGLLHHRLWDDGWDISFINTSQIFTLIIFIQDLLTDLSSYNPKHSELNYKIMVMIGVHVSYRLSSAGLGSGGSWVVSRRSPPGETTPHRHLDTSVLLLLLLLALPMMKMPELHSVLKSEIWNITSQRPRTVF